MSKTLVLLFHPDITRSCANAALSTAASQLAEVEIFDVQQAYPNGVIDTDAEVHRLLGVERIVLQYPIQWYATPPILKAWLDAVLTRLFYINYESEGRRLRGMPIMVSVTAGNSPDAYSQGGRNMFTMSELLAPVRATAHRCDLTWNTPFIVYRANQLSRDELKDEGTRYVEVLKSWISSTGLQEI